MRRTAASKIALTAAVAGMFAAAPFIAGCSRPAPASDGKAAQEKNGCSGRNGCAATDKKDANGCKGHSGCSGKTQKN